MRSHQAPVNSMSSGNLAKRWNDVLESLPEHLTFVKSSVKQNMLTVDFTDVGIVLRPLAEIVHHRLEDKLAALKAHLVATYGVALGVQLVKPRGVDRGSQANDNVATPSSSSATPATDEDLLPIERTLIELFKARRASTPGN
ncbi:MAG: hypothetical protein IPP80_03865 [Ignavibacteria bacterium]|nr:hypothetical protein [Ignavibacteria bacterium]